MKLYIPSEIVLGVFGEFGDEKVDDTRIDDWYEVAKVGIEQLRAASCSNLSFPSEFAAKKLAMLADLLKTGQVRFPAYTCGGCAVDEAHEAVRRLRAVSHDGVLRSANPDFDIVNELCKAVGADRCPTYTGTLDAISNRIVELIEHGDKQGVDGHE